MKKLLFAACLTVMAAAFVSRNECEKNPVSHPNVSVNDIANDVKKDSLMLLSEVWEAIATDDKMDFSQDTTHILIEKKSYNIKAVQNGDISGVAVIFENNQGGRFRMISHGAGRGRSAIEGSSLYYQGKHNGFDHYVLIVDQKKYAEAQVKAKAKF